MSAQPAPPLAPHAAAALVEFARACKAAARAVSLYPGGHPAIRLSLSRLVEVTDRTTASGAFRLKVRPDLLLVENAAPSRPDAAIVELAALLHGHLIGSLVLHGGTDADSWRTLLLLLARSPEEVREDGGIAQLWTTAGGPSIEIQEIDYAQVLREGGGGEEDTFEAIIEACLRGSQTLDLDDAQLRHVLAFAKDPAKLEALTARLLEAAAARGATAQAEAFVRLLRGLSELIMRAQPELLDAVLRQAAGGAGRLSADAMMAMLLQQKPVPQEAGALDVVGAVVERMTDQTVAGFVAGSVIQEGGASQRLAEAFQALSPEVDRKRQLLSMAEVQVAESALGREEGFPELWEKVEGMLLSYSDDPFVSSDYARELSLARSQAIEVEQTGDDPPERIAAWLGTVNDASLRALDLQLLLDLLRIETDAARWRDVADAVAGQIEALARVGYLESMCELARAIAAAGHDPQHPERAPEAAAAIDRLARRGLIRHLVPHLRTGTEEAVGIAREIAQILGPAVIDTLAEVLSTETDARARTRLREILVGFGSSGREAVERLMGSSNWEVRRTAAYLLREFGGTEALPALEPLLRDAEPLVQREAIHALVRIGEDRAFALVARALESGTARARDVLMQEVGATRDPRTGPLYCYLLRHLDHRGALTGTYLAALGGLAAAGGADDAVEALRETLQRGEWWAPFRTRRLRDAAAAALARLGTPAALDVLRAAAAAGPRGVRLAARQHLGSAGGGSA